MTRLRMALGLLLPVFLAMWAVPGWAQSLYEGSWRGTWADRGLGQSGSVSLQIDGAGNVAGRVGNGRLNATGPMTGTAGPDGHMRLQYTYDNRTVYTADGVMRRTGDRIAGQLGFYLPGGRQLGAGQFVLTLVGGRSSGSGSASGTGRPAPRRGGRGAEPGDAPGSTSNPAPAPSLAPAPASAPASGGGRKMLPPPDDE